jgi:flavin-dependent dehydrogenase
VSYGIRRCEFDSYLLTRSSARLTLGTPVRRVSRHGSMWTVNESLTAPMLVGAGGHFCEIGRLLNGRRDTPDVVVAQEAEVYVADDDRLSDVTTLPNRPELYFSRSFDGYGWCVRKGGYLNVGFGQLRHGPLPDATEQFVTFLKSSGVIGEHASFRWKGHAYALVGAPTRRVDDGVLLVGDAAGLAARRSGEGIGPAVESGLLAASSIIRARGRYTADRLGHYERALRERFGGDVVAHPAVDGWSAMANRLLAPWLLRTPWFVRHVLLDRWFLHAADPPLAVFPA